MTPKIEAAEFFVGIRGLRAGRGARLPAQRGRSDRQLRARVAELERRAARAAGGPGRPAGPARSRRGAGRPDAADAVLADADRVAEERRDAAQLEATALLEGGPVGPSGRRRALHEAREEADRVRRAAEEDAERLGREATERAQAEFDALVEAAQAERDRIQAATREMVTKLQGRPNGAQMALLALSPEERSRRLGAGRPRRGGLAGLGARWPGAGRRPARRRRRRCRWSQGCPPGAGRAGPSDGHPGRPAGGSTCARARQWRRLRTCCIHRAARGRGSWGRQGSGGDPANCGTGEPGHPTRGATR